ncbi:PadR family transcriptional regulator [Natronomonas sp.]|uniref:PadR family transcriptional regulator n=1 Tax=Natronomonas sp. TaxID=2184060 RepID=UPI002FC3CBE1
MSREGRPDDESSGNDHDSAVERLVSELDVDASCETDTPVARAVEDATSALNGSDEFGFDEDHVKASLDDLLVALVALRSTDTHGKQLLDDLAGEFGTALSPGTVYPRLHDLCEGGPLERRELVKTKEYTLEDETEVSEDIAAAARQHLTLGMIFRAALEHGDFE